MIGFLYLGLVLAGTEKEGVLEVESKSENVCEVLPSHAEMFVMAKRYYEQHGDWANIFTLSSAHKERVVQKKPKKIGYHLRYQYIPIPNNPAGRVDSGSDQRLFTFRCVDAWYVSQMGEFMSAIFP